MKKEEALKILRDLHDKSLFSIRTALETLMPELRESEDERIRKSIVDFIKSHADEFEKSTDTWDMLAWLEKQKEQTPVDDGTRAKIISRATSEKQVVLVSESDGNAEIGWDTRSLEDAKNLLEYGISFINKQLGVKPAEWSEKDKMNLNGCICSLHQYGYMTYADFLKHLPERFNLQVKQEWSEEDEKMLNEICANLYALPETREKWQKFLKSLRSSWKPSKKQMDALWTAKSYYGRVWACDIQKALESLYNDLEKQM